MKKNNIKALLLISCGLFIVFHLFPLYKNVTWKALLEQSNTTHFLPRWLNDSQKAYLFYKQNNFSEAEEIRWAWLSWNNQYLYNLWTTLAQKSFLSGQLVDRNQLQKAEQYLSWAADLIKNTEIEHNLTVVRKLLEESWTWSESQQQQDQQNSTWDLQNSTWDQQQQNWSWTSQQNEQQQWSSSALSPELQQQIEQYKQQLEQEQQANQQFFWKQAPSNSDWFGFLDQLFWGTPQFQQQIDTWWEQDW